MWSHGVRRYALRGWWASVKKYWIGSIRLAGDVMTGGRQRHGGVVFVIVVCFPAML